jgi:hypothetical protein
LLAPNLEDVETRVKQEGEFNGGICVWREERDVEGVILVESISKGIAEELPWNILFSQ